MLKFLKKSVPFYLLLIAILANPFTFLFVSKYYQTKEENYFDSLSSQDSTSINVVRMQDTGLIKPLLFVESNIKDSTIQSIEKKVKIYIDSMKKTSTLITASVYVKEMNSAYRFEVNPNELYDPASLTKVALMLYLLSIEDEKTGFINKKLNFDKKEDNRYSATITSKTIQVGKKYTIKELIYYMIAFSDNDAFSILLNNIDMNDFVKLLEYFEIPMMNDGIQRANHYKNFVANVNSISRFFRVLYNSTFLSKKNSQFALSLLTQSDFKNGLIKTIPHNIKCAHKFGERIENGISQLHEFGIVYLEKQPYLIGVMTKGTDIVDQSEIISKISKIVYDGMLNK